MFTLRLVLVLCLGFSAAAHAADALRRPITSEDLWAVKRLSAPALSPDGRRAVVSVQEWSVEKNKATASLWLTELVSGQTRRLTNSNSSDTAPAWNAAGSHIAFVSKRGEDETAALYVIAADGGEAEEIVELPYGISTPRWLPGKGAVVFATQVIPALAGKLGKDELAAMKKEAKRRKDSKMTAYVTEHRQYRYFDKNLTDLLANRLVKVDIETKVLSDLTPGFDRLFLPSGEIHYELAPDGRSLALAVNSTPPPYAAEPNNDIYLIPADGSGGMRNLTADNPRNDDAPHFAPDGASLLFVRQVLPTAAGELRRLWRHDLADGRNTPLTAKLELSVDEFAYSADGRSIYLQAEDQGRVPLFRMRADGSGLTRLFGEGSNTALDSAAGQVIFLHENSQRAAELYALDPKTGKTRTLTRFNEALFAALDLGRVESHTFNGAAGDPVQLWLSYPPGYDPARKYPLVLTYPHKSSSLASTD